MLVLVLVLFGGGMLYEYVQLQLRSPARRISNGLLFSVKNPGFAAVTSVTLAGERAAIPSAALSVVLLVYLLGLSLRKSGT